MELVCYTQESHTIIPSRVHHSVEELSKVNHSWQKVCHFWHPFSIHVVPTKLQSHSESVYLLIYSCKNTGI